MLFFDQLPLLRAPSVRRIRDVGFEKAWFRRPFSVRRTALLFLKRTERSGTFLKLNCLSLLSIGTAYRRSAKRVGTSYTKKYRMGRSICQWRHARTLYDN